jgi:hypothetical protein
MTDVPTPRNRGRGQALLLAHCRVLGEPERFRPPAFRRLEQAVGDDLARLLVTALSGRHQGRTQLAA